MADDYLSELDDGEAEPALQPAQTSLPEGIANSRPAPSAPQLRDTRGAPAEQPFEIVETDDNFNPIVQRPAEPRLNEIDAGPRSLVERQAAEQAEQDRIDVQSGRQPRRASERREARRQGRERTLAENADLRQQVQEMRAWRESIEPQLAGIGPRLTEIDQGRLADQVAQIDRNITEQQQRGTDARNRISQAMISQDGEALAAALEQRDAAIMESQRLTVQKNMLTTGDPLGRPDQGAQPRFQPQGQPRQQPAPAQPPGLSPRAQALANDWAARHPWLRTAPQPNGMARGLDLDSNIALQIDQQVAAEYHPDSLEYWEELDDRMRQYLPHRFDEPRAAAQQRQPDNGRRPAAPQQTPPERRGPMVGGAGDGAPQQSGNRVYLSPARKEAMIAAGVLGRDGVTVENEAKFRRQLKYYQDHDRANGTVRQ